MQEIQNLIIDELNKVDVSLYSSLTDNNEIFKALKQFIEAPTKRIRSMLTILYLKAQKKNITVDIIQLLTAGELIHNASLLHDDVLDNADIRRGNTTISKQFSPRIAILAGDYLLSLAIQKLTDMKNQTILEDFQKCTLKMTDAEISQFCFRGNVPDLKSYLRICEGKTASLFETILASSATIVQLDKKTAVNFGRNFGILFQIKNDLEHNSANQDKKNQIYTAKDILGLEKTQCLTDNYLERLQCCIEYFPQNIYTQALWDISRKI